jgi:hypothetical protein
MRRGRAALDFVLWLAVAALLTGTARRLVRFSPLTRSRPATVVSGSEARRYEPLVLLLRKASEAVPAGSTFSFVGDPAAPADFQDYMIAVGQLPGRRVIFADRWRPPAGGEPPRFVACPGDSFPDPRFRRIRRFPEGSLYESRR